MLRLKELIASIEMERACGSREESCFGTFYEKSLCPDKTVNYNSFIVPKSAFEAYEDEETGEILYRQK
jgi:hypothetical protein